MDKKPLFLSLGVISLVFVVVLSTLTLSGLGRSHAASPSLVVAAPHELQAIQFKAFNVPVVQANVYYGADGNFAYAYNATTGTVLWRYEKSASVGMLSFMTVSGGSVFLDLWGIPAGSSDSVVVALDASTGGLRWTSSSLGYGVPGGSAYVANGILYFLRPGPYFYEVLYAISMSDGTLLWYTDANTVYSDGLGMFYTSMLSTHSEPYLMACALNAITGSRVWCFEHYDIVGIAQGVIYALVIDYNHIWSRSVIALRASDGTPLWSYNGPTLAAYADNILYVLTPSSPGPGTGTATLCALHVSDSSLRWCHAKVPYSDVCIPGISNDGGSLLTLKNGIVYVQSKSATQAFQAGNGSLLWTVPHASLLFADQHVVYLLSSSSLIAHKVGDTSVIWQSHTNLSWCLSLINKVIYCSSGDKHFLYAYDAANGKLLWTFGSWMSVTHSIIYGRDLDQTVAISWVGVTNGRVYTTTIITMSGHIILGYYAFDATTGTELWRF